MWFRSFSHISIQHSLFRRAMCKSEAPNRLFGLCVCVRAFGFVMVPIGKNIDRKNGRYFHKNSFILPLLWFSLMDKKTTQTHRTFLYILHAINKLDERFLERTSCYSRMTLQEATGRKIPRNIFHIECLSKSGNTHIKISRGFIFSWLIGWASWHSFLSLPS